MHTSNELVRIGRYTSKRAARASVRDALIMPTWRLQLCVQELLLEALKARKETLGNEHPDTVASLANSGG